jgi:hypothetical protein
LGQKQTTDWRLLMSALPPKADIGGDGCDVRFVPKAEVTVIRSVELMVQPYAGDVGFQVKVRKDQRVTEVHIASRANPSHCRSHLDTLTS